MADGKVVIDVLLNDGKVAKGVAKVDGRLHGLGRSANAGALTVGKLVKSLGLVGLASKGIDMVSSAIDGAISRYDTLNNFPRVMQQMGFDAQSSEKAINKLSDGIQGLPTTLDSVASTAQRIAVLTGDLDGAVETTLALNNAFLASGASSADAERGLTQYLQMLAKGKVDMDAWNTLQETMGVALNDTAKAFGFTGKSAQMDLYEALQSGKITFDEFNAKIIELSNAQGGFAERAKTATGGIRTAWTNMNTAVVKGVADVIGAIDKALGGTGSIEKIIGKMQAGIKTAFTSMAENIPVVAQKIKAVYDIVKPFIPLVVGLVGAITTFKTTIAIINSVKNAIMAARIAVIAFNTAMMTNPFVAIVAAVIGLAIIIYMYWDEIGEYLTAAWDWIKETAVAVWNGILAFFKEWGLTILAIITGPIGILIGLIIKYWDDIKAVTLKVWNAIKSFFSNLWNGIISIVTAAVMWYLNRVITAWNNIKSVTSTVWNGIKSFFSSIWNGIKSVVSGAVNGVKSTITSIWNKIKSVTSSAWNGIKSTISNGITGAWNVVKGYVSRFLNSGKSLMTSLAKGIKQGLTSAISAVKNGMKKVRSYLPFSPAKEGPLSDLDKSGESFFPTWADGMEKGERKLVRQVEVGMGRVAELLGAVPAVGGRSMSVAAAGPSVASGEPSPIIVQNMHVREEADIRRVADELWRLQQRRDRRRIGR